VDSGGLKEAQVKSHTPGGASVPTWEGHIGATWRIRLNHPSAAAMRFYVELLWQFVYFLKTLSLTWID